MVKVKINNKTYNVQELQLLDIFIQNQVLKMNLQRKHSRMTVKMLFIICLMLATDIQ